MDFLYTFRDAKPLAWYSYTSIVWDRLIEYDEGFHKGEGDPNLKEFWSQIFDKAQSLTKERLQDNKIVILFEVFGCKFFIGYKDWNYALGLTCYQEFGRKLDLVTGIMEEDRHGIKETVSELTSGENNKMQWIEDHRVSLPHFAVCSKNNLDGKMIHRPTEDYFIGFEYWCEVEEFIQNISKKLDRQFEELNDSRPDVLKKFRTVDPIRDGRKLRLRPIVIWVEKVQIE